MAALRSVFRRDLFSGKVAIVTGGGTGIGRGITEELALLGCKVVIAARKIERLQEAAQELNQSILERGGGAGVTSESELVYPRPCNIRNEAEVEALMRHTVDTHGRIDYLVNNGGGQFQSPFADLKTKGWHAVIDTNLNGTYYCLKHVYHTWMRQHGGAIVNIIVDMVKGFPGMAHSGAARAGVENLTRSLAIEWAPENIRINAIAPKSIYSDTAAKNYPPGRFERNIQNIPAQRLGVVEEVSGVVCFYLSPAAAYVTGTTLYVDGGQSIYRSPWTIPDHEGFPLLLKSTLIPPKGEDK